MQMQSTPLTLIWPRPIPEAVFHGGAAKAHGFGRSTFEIPLYCTWDLTLLIPLSRKQLTNRNQQRSGGLPSGGRCRNQRTAKIGMTGAHGVRTTSGFWLEIAPDPRSLVITHTKLLYLRLLLIFSHPGIRNSQCQRLLLYSFPSSPYHKF